MLALLPTLHLSSAAPLTLEGSTLRLAGAGGSVLLEGMDRSLRASPSGTGGVFLHGDFREPMAAADVSLGTLHCGRLLSTARCTRYWMAPAVGDSAADVPLDSQMVLLEFAAAAPRVGAEAACYALMLPLVDREARSSLSAAGMSLPRFVRRLSRRLLPRLLPRFRLARGLSLHVESGDEAVRVPAGACLLYVAAGADPYELLARGVAEVAARLGTFAPRAAKPVPPSADVFGWCTWDGFYSRVAPEDVLAGAASLNEAGVPPRLIVLDDGWQTVTPPPPPAAAEPAPERAPAPAPVRPALAEAAAAEEAAAGQVAVGQVAVGQVAGGQVAAAGPAPPPAAEASGVVERLAGRVSLQLRRAFAVLAAAASRGLQRWYERVVSRSRYGSLPVRVWTLLATRLLRSTMEEYYESETDFGRQLGAFAPNRKFEASASGEAAERAGGPKLARLVRELKQRHGVRYVYAWHALHGYWRGVAASLGAAEGLEVQQVFARPSAHLQRVEPQVRWDAMTLFGTGLLLSRPQLDAFFARLHAPLAAAGVDGVKVDVQSGLASLGGGVGGGPSLAARYVGALEASVATTFGPHLIHCMCHSTENLYRYTHGSLLRASDDFYPSRPASHTMHIVNVGYNSLLLGELGVPDWDMFTSLNEAASLHAAARAISGGPVYVSDAPGQHDVALLRKLVLPDGATLRAAAAGRPTRDCLFADVTSDGVSALKLWNYNGNHNGECNGEHSGAGTARLPPNAVVGAFNVQGARWDFETHGPVAAAHAPQPVSALVRPHDADCLRPHGGRFAVWSHLGSRLEVLPSGSAAAQVTLQHREWEVLTIAPVLAQGRVEWAPLGLVEMINAGGAVVATTLTRAPADDHDAEARLTSRAAGRFLAYCTPRPASVWREGGELGLPFSYDDATGLLAMQIDEATASKPAELLVHW